MNSTKTLFSLASIATLTLLGCSSDKAPTADSAKPAMTSASAASSSKPTMASASAAAAPSAAPTGESASAASKTASGDSIKFMPKSCEEARVFVNLGKFLSGDVGTAAQGLYEKVLGSIASSGKPGDDKTSKLFNALRDGGIDPMNSVREISLCAGKGNKALVAVAMDFSGAKGKPVDVFAKAMEASSGKAPTREEDGGVTYLSTDKDKPIAFVSPTVIVAGSSKEAIKAVVKGGDGGADFAGATDNVVWAKVVPDGPGSDADITVKDVGTDYQLKIVFMPPGKDGAEFKKNPDAVIKKFNDQIAAAGPSIVESPFKAAAPAIKNAKLAKEGDRMALTTLFPQAMIAALATVASAMDTKQLMHAF